MPICLPIVLCFLTACQATGADATIEIRDLLVVPGRQARGRSALPDDPIEARRVRGVLTAPGEGQPLLEGQDDSPRWKRITARPDGLFDDPALRGGYAHASVTVPNERIAMLEAVGASSVVFNGEPRVGDVYSHGYVKLPVLLRQGRNDIFFQVGRGSLRCRLVAPQATAFLDAADSTLPDLQINRSGEELGALVVVNASTEWLENATLRVRLGTGQPVETPVAPIPPLALFKAPFRLPAEIRQAAGAAEGTVELLAPGRADRPAPGVSIRLEVVDPGQTRKETFLSDIDGSVQYYGVVPPLDLDHLDTARRPGLLLTLHGASVEGIGQARAYARKPGVWIVAPTNRRPYGFDWEEWGRLDALEVLDRASREFEVDERRVWLTGHSMGGHGTWQVGATFPDRFAAVAPSAGWISLMSYGGLRNPSTASSAAELLRRLTSPSDTLALVHNLAPLGVYVLHGDADDNVPVTQAREMRAALGGFHPDFAYYERPGAGHWWGNACVDWPPLTDFLFRHERPLPSAVTHVDFWTAHPGVSSRCDWATVHAQERPFETSEIHLRFDRPRNRVSGSTKNVARLGIDLLTLDHKPGPFEVELDGTPVVAVGTTSGRGQLWLEKGAGGWRAAEAPDPHRKNPERSGPFRSVFRNRVQLVVATGGTPEENAWSLAKARFDAETFWYRGNGAISIVRDIDFDPTADPDRNVVLYGHSGMNRAWSSVVETDLVRVGPGEVAMGGQRLKGEGLGCLILRPRRGSSVALVGIVAGTGLPGLRALDRLPLFVSGVAYPDLFVAEWTPTGRLEPRAAVLFDEGWNLPPVE